MAIFWFSSWEKKFELKEKVTSQAELKILQLKLRLEPAHDLNFHVKWGAQDQIKTSF